MPTTTDGAETAALPSFSFERAALLALPLLPSQRVRPGDVVSMLPAGAAAVDEALNDDRACGPGWYESSRELRCGLEVREGLPADADLDEWIGACLAA